MRGTVSGRMWLILAPLTEIEVKRSVEKGWRSRSDVKWVVIFNVFGEKSNCVPALAHPGTASRGSGKTPGARAVPAKKHSKEYEHVHYALVCRS